MSNICEGLCSLFNILYLIRAQVIPGVAIAFCSYELMKKLMAVQVNVTNR